MAVTNRYITIEDSVNKYNMGLSNNEYRVLLGAMGSGSSAVSYLSTIEYSKKLYCPTDNHYVINTKGLPSGGSDSSTKYITETEALFRYTYFTYIDISVPQYQYMVNDSVDNYRYRTVKFSSLIPATDVGGISIKYGLLNYDGTNNQLQLSKFSPQITTSIINSNGSVNSNTSLSSLIDYSQKNYIKIRYPIVSNGITPTANTRYLFEINFLDTVNNISLNDFTLIACFHYYGTSSIPSVSTRDIPVTIINQTGKTIYNIFIKFCVYKKVRSVITRQPQYTGEIFPSYGDRTIYYRAEIANNSSSMTTSITIDYAMLSAISSTTNSSEYCKIGIEYISIDYEGTNITDPYWDNRYVENYTNNNTSDSSPFKFSPSNLMGIDDIDNTNIIITIRPTFLNL